MRRSALDNRERLPLRVTDDLHRTIDRLNVTIERQVVEISRLRDALKRAKLAADLCYRTGSKTIIEMCAEALGDVEATSLEGERRRAV